MRTIMINKRKFMAGVVVTLANRPAWSQSACTQLISATTAASITTGNINSLSPDSEQAYEDLQSAMADPNLDVENQEDGSICIKPSGL